MKRGTFVLRPEDEEEGVCFGKSRVYGSAFHVKGHL